MKKRVTYCIIFSIVGMIAALTTLNGCELRPHNAKPNINPYKYGKVFMPQARKSPFKVSFIINDTTISYIRYSATYGGPKREGNDNITVRFKINPALQDSFNLENSTTYKLLPKDSYIMGKTEANIPVGELSTPIFKIKLKKGKLKGGGTKYLLPMVLNEKSGGIKVNKNLQTTYFLIQGTYKKYNQADWKIVECNHTSAFPCSNLIDNNPSSFFNSTYHPPQPGPPHIITVDMGESHIIHGFDILGRLGSKSYIWGQNPKDITIEFSSDGKNWRDAENFTLPFTQKVRKARVFLSNPVKAHYFKFIIHSMVNSALVTNFAEIYAF